MAEKNKEHVFLVYVYLPHWHEKRQKFAYSVRFTCFYVVDWGGVQLLIFGVKVTCK